MVQEASCSSSEKKREEAWEKIYALYSRPLLNFIKFNSRSTEDPEDLLQSFLAYLCEKDCLAQADKTKGKCRTFLITILKRFLNDAYKVRVAQKRGGKDNVHLVVDLESAIADENQELDSRQFDLAWAQNLVDITMAQLETEAREKGKVEEFSILKYQLSEANDAGLNEAAQTLGKSVDALRMALNRLRKRFQTILRYQVAQTLSPGESVSSELRYLADLIVSQP